MLLQLERIVLHQDLDPTEDGKPDSGAVIIALPQ
jgi:hypothetical protein